MEHAQEKRQKDSAKKSAEHHLRPSHRYRRRVIENGTTMTATGSISRPRPIISVIANRRVSPLTVAPSR